MPYIKLHTNTHITDKPALLGQLSKMAAKETSKPESYVMVELADALPMLFGGTAAPLAYLECKSIGLQEKQAKALSAALCDLLHAKLSIPPERIYIEFSNAPAAFWGYNGSTFG